MAAPGGAPGGAPAASTRSSRLVSTNPSRVYTPWPNGVASRPTVGHVRDAVEHSLHDPRAEPTAALLGIDQDHAHPGQGGPVADGAAGAGDAPVAQRHDETAGVCSEEEAPVFFALVPSRGRGQAQAVGDVVHRHHAERDVLRGRAHRRLTR